MGQMSYPGELRLYGVLRRSGTKIPGELCRYAKIIPLMCSRLGETRTAAAPTEVDLELAMLTGVVWSNAKERVTNGDTIGAEVQRPWWSR
jgi:hypothetical protein